MKTCEDYREIMADRPAKFTEKEVGYESEASGPHQCMGCLHLYRSFVYPERIVCEIFRPAEDGNVDPNGWCIFWTGSDGELPYCEEEED